MKWCVLEMLLATALVGMVLPMSVASGQESASESHAEKSHEESSEGHDEAHSDESHTADDHGGGGHSGGGDHHDPTDLSHQNAGEAMEDPSELRRDLAVWTLVVFLGLLAILSKFAWGPVIEALEKREQAISDQIDEAKAGAEKAAETLQAYEAKLAAANEEARDIVAQARKDAEVAKDRILAEAQEAADRERRRAVDDIDLARNMALDQISGRSVDLAVAMAGRLIGRELKADDHDQLIQEALDQLPPQT